MAPKSSLPSCGFAVGGTKKGELQLKIEKRARGKKVTIIPNVLGDANLLARSLQSMLGVGGTARQAEKGAWAVEVQGDQVDRVTRALLDFGCLQGLAKPAMEALRKQFSKAISAVSRSAATTFLAQTREGGALSPEEERRRALEQEADFYGRFWESAAAEASAIDDFSDIWCETLSGDSRARAQDDTADMPHSVEMSTEELRVTLSSLGMIPECGRAVRQFWQTPGMTLERLRKMALNPGARLVTDDGPGRSNKPTNLISRQKMSDRSAGGRRNYFSCTSRIDDYERYGRVRSKEEYEVTDADRAPEAPKLLVSEDEEGWLRAALSYCVPLPVPPTRLDEAERSVASKRALRKLEGQINTDLLSVSQKIPGVECRLDCQTFGADLTLSEHHFLRPRGDGETSSKAPDQLEKEEMKLEKKLREISSLKRRQIEGETLEKNQGDKIAKRAEFFEVLAEMKLRRAEKDLLRVFKRYIQRFQDAFHDSEWTLLYGDTCEASTSSGGSSPRPFGAFDESSCSSEVVLSACGSRAESRGPSQNWAGVRLRLGVQEGEVGAFAVEVLDGLVRLGWGSPMASTNDLGADRGGFGFGSTGKKVRGGVYEAYGKAFKAGDVIHCEAERENGRLKIGFAKNNEPLGVAFDVEDDADRGAALSGIICGKGFKVRLISAESMPLEDAPVLEDFQEYDPARQAVVERDFSTQDEEDECLLIWVGEIVQVASNDGTGWLFGYRIEADDGGWFPADCVRFLADDQQPAATEQTCADAWEAPVVEDEWGDSGWDSAPVMAEQEWAEEEPALAPVAAALVAGTSFAPAARRGDPEGASPTAAEEDAGPRSIEGLGQWLQSASLQKYEHKIVEWCEDMGAVSLEEVKENWEEVAEALALKPLERKRLAKAAIS